LELRRHGAHPRHVIIDLIDKDRLCVRVITSLDGLLNGSPLRGLQG
jgi:hypothetical protein